MKKEEVLELAKKNGFDAIKADVLKLEASGREYYRLHIDNHNSIVMCYLNPDKGDHKKFIHVEIFLEIQILIAPKLF